MRLPPGADSSRAWPSERPTVLVFEDLHWADDGLLDFVDGLVDWATDVPLLVVASARPELLARRPGWGGGKPNAVTLSLTPLTDRETAELVHALLERSVLPADVQAAVLARAGGNPLYAEEFARLVAERGAGDGDLPVPDTVQALIAARLDALAPDAKRVLQGAAVVGKVFWPGALGEAVPEEMLQALERREFIRRERRSSVEGEAQYAFRHVLVRDVAYGEIPRGERADRHESVARWIESLGRGEETAELLAHHYAQALEYARAAGRDTQALARRSLPALAEAGRRAQSLGALESAGRFFDAALELTEAHDETWAALVVDRATALMYSSVDDIGPVAEAAGVFRAAGASQEAARAEMTIGERLWLNARPGEADLHLSAAEQLVADAPPSRAKAYVLAELARFAGLGDAYDRAIERATGALAMAEQLDLPVISAHALNSRGIARVGLGDFEGGLGDLEASIEITRGRDAPELIRALGNLASITTGLGDLPKSRALTVEALELATELGVGEPTRWLTGEVANLDYLQGSWDTAAPRIARLAEEHLATPFWMGPVVFAWHGRLLVARGAVDDARPWLERAASGARNARDLQMLMPSLAIAARAYEELGDDGALALAREVLAKGRTGGSLGDDWLKEIWFVLDRHGLVEELRPMLAQLDRTPWVDAAVALVDGDLAKAADIYAQLPAPAVEADVRMRAADRLAGGRAGCGGGRRGAASARLLPVGGRDGAHSRGRVAAGGRQLGVAAAAERDRLVALLPLGDAAAEHRAGVEPLVGQGAGGNSGTRAALADGDDRLLGRQHVRAAADEPVRDVAASRDVALGVLVGLADVEHLDRVVLDQLLELVERHRLGVLVVGAVEHVAGQLEDPDRPQAAGGALRLVLGRGADDDRLVVEEHEPGLRREARAVDGHADRAVRVRGEVDVERPDVEDDGIAGLRQQPDRLRRADERGLC